MGQLIQELKRRNVIRVAIAYAIAAWLLVEVSATTFPMLKLPEWTATFVTVLLMIGFPLALIFAWAYELTPEGIKLEKHVDRSQSVTHVTGRKLDYLIIVALILALSYFAFDKFVLGPARDAELVQATTKSVTEQVAESGNAKSAISSIAVMPFVNMSPDPEQEYFSDGISEELLTLLVQVDGLRVASRTSSFAFRGENKNLKEIADTLNVGYVLEGSVRKAGNRVRITAQLIDTETDRHLWSDSFDREFVDIFSIQEQIANAIVAALVDELNIPEPSEGITVLAVTDNLDAYELYLRARQLFIGRRQLDEAVRLFERAVELDPEFALAWEGLAAAEAVSTDWLRNDGVDHASRARSAANRALELDPDASMPYAVLGTRRLNVNPKTGHVNMVQAIDRSSTALEKDPQNATAWLWRGIHFLYLGFFEEAASDFAQCLEIDRAYMHCQIHLGAAEICQGNDARGLDLLQASLESNFTSNIYYFIPALLRSGNRQAAWFAAKSWWFGESDGPVTELIDAIENPDRDHTVLEAKLRNWSLTHELDPDVNFIFEIALLGGYDALDHDVFNGHRPTMGAFWDPSMAQFRGTPGFKFMARFAGLPDYWRARGFPSMCRPIGDDDFECD